MKHVWGLSDAVGGALTKGATCERCGGSARIGGKLCVRCLLAEGLADDTTSSAEEFEEVLAEADVVDQRWQLGNYEILGEIGRGAMGVIYRARQRYSGRVVAVKRLLSYQADASDTLHRFRREAEAAASLDHPNILPIYEVAETDGVPYFSMKWATGGSLRDVGPAFRDDPALCVRLMAKVARAIDYAHRQGILHRDLQPANILLDARGEPLVSDFGVAKWLGNDTGLTCTPTTFGTPGYIAPEQSSCVADVTPAADIYSLGAVLFNLLTGRTPFVGANALTVIRQAAENPAPKLRAIAPSLDRDLETIIERCLERDPEARYASAGDLAEDLERWLTGRAILARPVRPAARVWRWSRANPALAGFAATCVALAAVVGWLLFASESGGSAVIRDKSVAVLPFDNLNGDPSDNFFADGMQEEILTDLSRIADLKVISRSSVGEFAPGAPRNLRIIGRSLAVRHLLEGSVRRDRNRVRINAHLTDAQTGAQLWAEQYDRELADVFDIQSEIAQNIAGRLQAQLSPQEKATIAATPTADLMAYDLYLHAKELARNASLWTPERARSEIRLLQEAVTRDASFVPALCMLARAQLELYWYNFDHNDATLAAANAAIDTAAHYQPEAGEVHLARAIFHYWGRRDYAAALAELNRASVALPNDAEVPFFTALIARRQGDWEASTRQFERATSIDPRGLRSLFELARSNLFALKRYDDAAKLCDSILSWSRDFDFEVARAKVDVASRGDLNRLREVVERASSFTERPPGLALARLELVLAERDYPRVQEALSAFGQAEVSDSGYAVPRDYFIAIAAQHLGRTDEARAAFLRARDLAAANVAQRPVDAKAWIVQAEIESRLGRKVEAIAAGERARELLPVEKDAVDGALMMVRFAGVCAHVGEHDRAMDLLEAAVKLPGATNYGELKLEEGWDAERDNPRFQTIVASLAPRPAEHVDSTD